LNFCLPFIKTYGSDYSVLSDLLILLKVFAGHSEKFVDKNGYFKDYPQVAHKISFNQILMKLKLRRYEKNQIIHSFFWFAKIFVVEISQVKA